MINIQIKSSRLKFKQKKRIQNLYKRNFKRKFIKNYFHRFKHFFRFKTIVKRYYAHKNILKSTKFLKKYYQFCIKKTHTKTYHLLKQLEFRIDVILRLVHFTSDRLSSFSFLRKGYVSINGKIITHIHSILFPNDLLHVRVKKSRNIENSILGKHKKRRIDVRQKHQYKILLRRKKFISTFLRKSLFKNFFEISYFAKSLIYLQNLRNNELVKKKWIKIKNLKKRINIKKVKTKIKKIWINRNISKIRRNKFKIRRQKKEIKNKRLEWYNTFNKFKIKLIRKFWAFS